jgi:superfamily II DNA or RNA helicase
MIIIRVGNVSLVVEGELPPDAKAEVQKALSYVVPGFKFMDQYKRSQFTNRPWDGTVTVARPLRSHAHALSVPTGLLHYVRGILSARSVPYSVLDERVKVAPEAGWSVEGLSLRDYQQKVADDGLNRGRGIMQMATGGGKTECVVWMTANAATFPAMFYVNSCDLLEQTYDRFQKYVRRDGQPVAIGRVGAGHFDIQPITVATVQTCERALCGTYSKYDFDDFNAEDDTDLDEKQKAQLKDLIQSAPFAYVDECFSYHTPVRLANGKKRMIGALVNEKFGGEVVSFNFGTMKFEPRKVIGWVRKPPDHPLVHIRLGNVAGITCTNNHVFYTTRGKVKAGKLRRGDAVISSLQDKRAVQALSEEGRQVILGSSLGDGSIQFGNPKSVGARFVTTHCKEQKEYLNYKYSFLDKLSVPSTPIKSGYTGRQEPRNSTRSSPEIAAIGKMPKEKRVSMLDWLGLAMWYFDDGSYGRKSGSIATCAATDVVMDALVARFKKLGVKATAHKKRDKRNRLVYITTAGMRIFAEKIARFCPPCLRYKLPVEFRKEPLCTPRPGPEYGVMSVIGVKPTSLARENYKNERDVYCLTVESNHNFVAGGSVVQNCHHVSCDTIQHILGNSKSARLRFGGSASPWRDDGLDILIEAAFGRKFCEIKASFLIERGFLRPPKITFNHFRQALGPAGNFNAHYTKYVVENAQRNDWIAKKALDFMSKGLPTIILVKWVKHAEILADLIPGCEILAGSGESRKNPKKRKAVLDRMRSKELLCIVATTLLDEGVDVPSANAGIFAGGGKSSTRELQRVGRFIRVDPDDPAKDKAWIEEFMDHTQWLSHHARTRRKILETEPAFEISDNRATMSV